MVIAQSLSHERELEENLKRNFFSRNAMSESEHSEHSEHRDRSEDSAVNREVPSTSAENASQPAESQHTEQLSEALRVYFDQLTNLIDQEDVSIILTKQEQM